MYILYTTKKCDYPLFLFFQRGTKASGSEIRFPSPYPISNLVLTFFYQVPSQLMHKSSEAWRVEISKTRNLKCCKCRGMSQDPLCQQKTRETLGWFSVECQKPGSCQAMSEEFKGCFVAEHHFLCWNSEASRTDLAHPQFVRMSWKAKRKDQLFCVVQWLIKSESSFRVSGKNILQSFCLVFLWESKIFFSRMPFWWQTHFKKTLQGCGIPPWREAPKICICPWLKRNRKCQRLQKDSFIGKLYTWHGNWYVSPLSSV